MYIVYLLLGLQLVLIESDACSSPLSSFIFPKALSSALKFKPSLLT